MKWFWIILSVVVAIAIVVTLQPPQTTRVAAEAQAAERDAADAAAAAITAEPKSVPPAAKERVDANPNANPKANPKANPAAGAAASLANDLLTERAQTPRGAVADFKPPAAEASTSGGEAMQDGLDRTIPNATVSAGTLVRRPDGTILADGKFVIRGSGVENDPYVVPWELLTSAMDTFQPRSGMKEIPQRIAFLDGHRIRIDGYLAFPLIVSETKQLLVTYNQWDGCCIGVPPTAYDALEVTLASTIPLNRRHGLLFGAVSGVFKVEPLVSDGWLIGMYLLDDASIKLDL